MIDELLPDAPERDAAGQADHDLAARHAPVIRFDAGEPFLPLAAGYTVFRAAAPSPSFPRHVTLQPDRAPPAALAIEYAIWWDWDIQHLYELEHVWVYLDERERLVHCEASWHGGQHAMRHAGGTPQEDGRALVYSEPGKHAFAPDPSWFRDALAPHPRRITWELAGVGGLLVNDLFSGAIAHTPLADTLARTYLAGRAFVPSQEFSRRFAFAPEQLVPWPNLRRWVPRRIAWVLDELARTTAPETYRVLRVGHRGAAAHAPDNSLAGIERAAALGADAVEIDALRTADGAVVASHDTHVRAADGRLLAIDGCTLADLRAALGESAPPTLDEVLERCRALRLGLYLEIKSGAAVAPALTRLDALGGAEFTVLASFRPDWLADVRHLAPRQRTAVLFSSPAIDAVALAASCGAQYVHPCWERRSARPDELLSAAWVARVRAAGLGIICWHEERPEVIAGMRRAGVDGICSDRPELLA